MEDMRNLEQETRNSILATQSDISAEIRKTESEVSSALDTNTPDKPA
jgi:hypothetical protein